MIDHSKGVTADVIRAYDDVTISFDNMKKLELKGQLGSKVTNFGKNGILNLKTTNIAGWEKSVTETPDFSVNKELDASFNMIGDKIGSVIHSNIPNITSELTYNDPYKLVIGEGQTIIVPSPIFNVVYDQDNKITGFGEPGATIVASINGTEIGTGVVDGDGRWSIDIIPQKAGTVIDIVQVIDGNSSEVVSQTVKHLTAQTVNYFKVGYWQPYGLVLEGSIDNADYDLTDTNKVHKKLSLVDSSGAAVLTVDGVNTDWYNTGVYNGYQSIFVNEDLDKLATGTYKVVISMSVDGYDSISQDLNVINNPKTAKVYHTEFNEIESSLLPSGKTVTPINNNGIGYIQIQ